MKVRGTLLRICKCKGNKKIIRIKIFLKEIHSKKVKHSIYLFLSRFNPRGQAGFSRDYSILPGV